ncbi:endonuclease/exonuclease/phosphatase family protein, partial [Kitasatospora sp. NPDC056531]|uniref:endonuclease/exonuclease/phosphatase family protein n=1 Tax=Kitasatospora sp. NPDC056531 TaxID=3345856 RepID=UPI00369087BD
MRIRSLCAALLSMALLMGLPAAVLGTASAATAGTATPPLRFFSYNMCGGSSWGGGTYCTLPGEVTNRDAYVTSEATTWNSDLLFLTEICKSQFDGLQSSLGPSGYHGAYVETLGTVSSCALNGGTSQSEGVALFSKGADPAPNAQTIYLGEHAGRETVNMVCADTTLQGRAIKACTYHPSAAMYSTECPDYPSTTPTCLGTTQQRQGEVARKAVEPWIAAGIPVVVGGDFNASPTDPSLDSFYDFGGGFGRFTEVDETDKTQFGNICPQNADRCRTGKYTYDLGQTDQSKIDYVFLSSRDFTSPYAATPHRNDTISDHGDLMGAAAWAGCADPANAAVAKNQVPCNDDTTSSVRGDFNGDGKADIGVLYNYGLNPDGTNHTGLWTFTSTGTGFANPVEVSDSRTNGTGSWNWSSSKVVAGDFNGDGKADIGVLYNYGTNPDSSY